MHIVEHRFGCWGEWVLLCGVIPPGFWRGHWWNMVWRIWITPIRIQIGCAVQRSRMWQKKVFIKIIGHLHTETPFYSWFRPAKSLENVVIHPCCHPLYCILYINNSIVFLFCHKSIFILLNNGSLFLIDIFTWLDKTKTNVCLNMRAAMMM